jgi:dolichyl-phosphooligosaccharide-protein glycotransferase
MESSEPGWWRRHAWTVALLTTAFWIGILIRTVWMAPLIEQFGPLYLYGGGSDSFYHSRVMSYIITNHSNLILDPLLRYPTGAVNPREPLFDWMNAVAGLVFAPFFGGNAVVAGAWFLDAQGPIWASLGVIPIYLIGKEVASKRAGIIAAFLYPLMVANIDSSTFGYANYLSFYTFFILLTIYAFIRTIRASGSRRWVESYRHPRQIPGAIRRFAQVERTSVKWAVFTGVSFGALALAWQGYSFAVAAMIIFLIVILIVERIRRVDSFGLYVNMWIIGLVGFPMAMPYYVKQGLFAGWFDLPLLVYFGALLIALPFILLRDTPWVVSIPVLILIGAIGIATLDVVNHAFFINIVTGQGYFVKTLVYSTVAEAQAPSVDSLIIGYGVATFFLAFVGLALLTYRISRERVPRQLVLFLVFGVISIYLPLSAAKFFYLGSAGFALLSADAIVRLIDVARYPELRRTTGQLADRRGQFTAFRRAFKPRHILVMALVLVIITPNIWYAVDAGVPYNSKSQFSTQIYDTLPPVLRTNPSNASSFYLGAGGTQLDTPAQYDEAGYNWLAEQDQNLPPPDRPAFISWWDYGFQAIDEGLHPSVADNFQNGIDPAGNFLLAQNESLAIALLATTLLQAEQTKTGQADLPAALNTVLANDGVNLAELHLLLTNGAGDVALVEAYPNRYLAVDPTELDPVNAMYDAVSYFLASSLSENGVAQVYNDIQTYTGWSIRYAMVDSRLIPFSGSNTGIFYAPADLTDRIIGSGGAPTSYYTLSVLGSDGNTYSISDLPAGVSAVQYNINYEPAFYNSMIYRTYFGYSGAQIGSDGIPGLSGSISSDPIEPGWMLQHFQVVYKTAYYCPYASSTGHPNCFTAMNLPQANALAKQFNGTVDSSANSYFSGGEAMLEYYPGEPMVGTVTLPNGAPVSGARVTVYDSWNIPHMTTLTSSDGSYSVILPPGNDTVNVTMGTVDGLTQAGATNLLSIQVPVPATLGLSATAPTLIRPIVLKPGTVQGFVYWNNDNNSSYIPHTDSLLSGGTLTIWGSGLTTRTITTDASGSFVLSNVAPGVYNVSIGYLGGNFSQPQLYVGAGATVNETQGLTAASIVGTVRLPGGAPATGATVTVSTLTHGVVGSAFSNGTGYFTIGGLGVGNYTVQASLSSQSVGSPVATVDVVTPGDKFLQNLTMDRQFTLDLTVVVNGNPGASIPVRFTPITILAPPAPPANGSAGAPGGVTTPTSPGQANSSVFYSNANGLVSATLPVGNYSIYGLGYSGTTLYAGFEDAYLPGTATIESVAPLFLSPASSLGGRLVGASVNNVQVPTEVLVYNAQGSVVSAFANTTGTWGFELPIGTYSVLAVQGLTTTQSTLSSALASVALSGSATLDLTLVPSVSVDARIGSPVCCTAGAVFPAASAEAQLTLDPLGATITAVSDANGNVSFVVPTSAPPGSSYCLTASAAGYLPYSSCDLSPSQLQQTTAIPLAPYPVAVNVTIVGIPSGSEVTLNFTAKSPTAQTVAATGSGSFSLSLLPGTYEVSAWGRAPSSGLLLPPGTFTTVVGFGSGGLDIRITVIRQVVTTGALELPAGVDAGNVTVQLASATQNLTFTGSAFSGRFLATPGTYTYYASASGENRSYAGLGSITIGSTGAFSGLVTLAASATRVVANLTRPQGPVLSSNASVTITSSDGFSLTASAVAGQLTTLLPSGASYTFSVTTTQLVTTASGGSVFQSFVVAPGYACDVQGNATFCNVPLVATSVLSGVSGQLTYPGYPGELDGEVEFTGPAPSDNATTVSVVNGSFSVVLPPGTYSVYASAGGAAAPIANISEITVGATPTIGLTIGLASTWTDALTLSPPAGGVLGNALVTVSTAAGQILRLPDELFGSTILLSLPAGVYTVSASAPASPYGVVTNATATSSVPLLSGNAATQLSLTYRLVQTASIIVAAPTTAYLGNGGLATFAYAVTDTGNAPENLHFVGSPSTFNFTFSPANVSLGPTSSNRSIGGEVTIRVPVGTPVSYPTISLEALLASGQPAGFATPEPTIYLTPVYSLSLGAGALAGAVVGPYSATVPFYLRNTGTASTSVELTVADSARLQGLGWSSEILSGQTKLVAPVTIAAAANISYALKLTAPSAQAIPPGTATVQALLLNGTQAASTLVLTIPPNAVTINGTSLVVTGPSLTSAPTLPGFVVPILVFVPTAALLIVLGIQRYLKTRRWSRR